MGLAGGVVWGAGGGRVTGAVGNLSYGRTLGGLRAEGDAHVHASEPAKNAPCAEYRIYLFGSGEVEVTAITAPTLNFVPGRGLRYAASFDDEPPQTVEIIRDSNRSRSALSVMANATKEKFCCR